MLQPQPQYNYTQTDPFGMRYTPEQSISVEHISIYQSISGSTTWHGTRAVVAERSASPTIMQHGLGSIPEAGHYFLTAWA